MSACGSYLAPSSKSMLVPTSLYLPPQISNSFPVHTLECPTRGVGASVVDVGDQVTYTLTGLNSGQTYFFAVTAYDLTGIDESPFSNEISTTVP